MRCKVETRKVVKTKPETKCERVPKETCRKHACNPLPTKSSERRDESGCYMMEKTVSEIYLSILGVIYTMDKTEYWENSDKNQHRLCKKRSKLPLQRISL